MFSPSNSGASAITKYMLEKFREGQKRDDLKLVEVEKILAKEAYNMESKGKLNTELTLFSLSYSPCFETLTIVPSLKDKHSLVHMHAHCSFIYV